jgi:predicted metal-dependent hydrolase
MFQLPLLSLFGPRRASAPKPARPARTEPYALEAAGLTATVSRKPMRTLRLRLVPPDGRLLVSAPLRVSDKAIRDFIIDRRDWIEAQRARMARAPRAVEPQLVDGEALPLLGRTVTLRVQQQGSRASAKRLGEGTVLLRAPAGSGLAQRRAAMGRFCAKELLAAAEALLPARCEAMVVPRPRLKVRAMRSRWGSCNTRTAVITLALSLASRPLESLDYILVHELAHLHVRSHGPRFKAIVAKQLPEWKARRKALNGTDATE